MNKLKRKFVPCRYYQSELIKKYLNEMALDGYKLNRITRFGWLFEEVSPTELKHDVCYSNEIPVVEEWDLVCSYRNMYVFSSEKDDSISVEGDEEVKFQLINKVMMKTDILVLSILFMIVSFQFCVQVNYIRSFPLEALGYNLPIFALGFLIAIFATLIPLFSYTNWYDKSKEQIKEGGACLVSDENLHKRKTSIVKLLFIISLFLLIIPTFSLLNSTSSTSTITKTIFYENGMSREVVLSQDEIPITFQDLGFEDNEYYSYNNSYDINSLFVKYNLSHQSKLHTSQEDLDELVHFDYNIIDVKFTPSFQHILNSLIDTSKVNLRLGSHQQQEYVLADYPNLDNFYQLFYGNIPTGKYVITKGDRIAFIEFYAYLPSDELLNLMIQKILEY